MPLFKKWGINTSNPEQLWAEADADGMGMILFIEFCSWAINKQLDLDDDNDDDQDEMQDASPFDRKGS